jgi:hypothetical protein
MPTPQEVRARAAVLAEDLIEVQKAEEALIVALQQAKVSAHALVKTGDEDAVGYGTPIEHNCRALQGTLTVGLRMWVKDELGGLDGCWGVLEPGPGNRTLAVAGDREARSESRI